MTTDVSPAARAATPPPVASAVPAPASRRHRVALGLVLASGFALRLTGIGHGLPFAFNEDEALHFVPQAADAADGDLDPDYYQNPSALTYLLAIVFRVCFLTSDMTDRLADDPGSLFLVARVVVAALGTLLVYLVYRAGSRFYSPTVGLLAGALLAFSFLPVFYSHQALNDVPTLLPVAIALLACLEIHDRGGWRWWLIAGAAVGAATGTKYLAAPLCLAVALVALLRLLGRRDPLRTTVTRLLAAAGASIVALVALNPYLVLRFPTARRQFLDQSAVAAEGKIGQHGIGWTYYPETLLWGLGVLPVLAAILGAALALRADWRKALLLVLFPIVLYLYMAGQGRFFGRWMLPAYPALAILAGYGTVRLATWVRQRSWIRHRSYGALVLPVASVLLLAQPVADSVRSDLVLLRTDTRLLAHDWVADNLPEGTRVVVEPSVPSGWIREDLVRYPVARPYADYSLRLDPGDVDSYRAAGYCWVIVFSHQRDRALSEGLDDARAYYDRLADESTLERSFSPYDDGGEPPAFSFDFSFNWYPPAYERPGPAIELRRLHGC